jgi:hypothetical protein
MPITYQNSRSLMTLNSTETTDLLIGPAILLSQPLLNDLRIFRVFSNVRGKKRIAVLQNVKSVMREPINCAWKPYQKSDWSGREWSTCKFQLQFEICKEEFDGCLELIEAEGVQQHNPMAGDVDMITRAYIEFVKLNLKNDIATWVWFGDEDFGTADYVWGDTLADFVEPSELARMTETLARDCNGIWRTIFEMAANGEIKQQVQAVKAGADATNPTDVERFLDSMLAQAPSRLKGLRSTTNIGERPVFLVQPDIFEALYTAYSNRCACEANAYIMEGTPIDGVLMYKGFPVVSVPEWQTFDEAIGAYKTKSMYQRAIFTKRGADANLAILHSAADLADGQGFMVEHDDTLRGSFKTLVQADFRLGVGVIDAEMIVFATNIGGVDPNTLL